MPKLDPTVLHHPAVVEQSNKRAADVQLRIADKITAFAGSMNFVYLHIVLFAIWMLVFEKSPWPSNHVPPTAGTGLRGVRFGCPPGGPRCGYTLRTMTISSNRCRSTSTASRSRQCPPRRRYTPLRRCTLT